MEKQQIEKKKVGSRVEANKNRPNIDEEKPPALITKTVKNVKYEYRFLKTVHSLEELDDFRFQNGCKFGDVKRRPEFMSLILHCTRRAKKAGMCPFALMAERTAKGGNEFRVYANSRRHNHTMKSEVERAAHRVPNRELVPDANPPVNFATPDGRQWTFMGTAKDQKEMEEFRLKHHCRWRNDNKYELTRISMHCHSSNKCKFHLLARKTDAQRYHMYTSDRHTCRHADDNSAASANSVKARNDEEELEEEVGDEEEVQDEDDDEEEHMVDAEESGETEEEVLEITAEDTGPSTSSGHIEQREWTIDEIQRRLAKALLEGRADRVNKWMGRIGPHRIGALLQTLSFVDIVKLLEMAKQQIREGRGNEKISDWLAWVQTALRAHHSELKLTPVVNMVDDLLIMASQQGKTQRMDDEEEMEDGEEEEEQIEDDEEESVEEEVEEEGGLEETAEDAAGPSTTTSNKKTTDEPKERPIEEGTKHQMEKKRKRRHHQCSMDNNNEEEDIFQQQPLENTAADEQSSLNLAEQLRKMEEKLASLGVESRAEIDSVKAENRVFLEKNNVMAAKMGEMQARLEVAELKAKMANDQMAKLVDARVAELAGQWTEKLMSQAEKKIEELGQEFASKMAAQFVKGMTEFERKMTQLECQAAICQNKQEEFAAKLANFEAANQQNEELLCSNDSQWDSTGHVQVDEKDAGKTSWTNVVRAQMPISRTSLASTVPGRLVYYEVLVRNEESAKYFYYIGWVGPDFPLEHSWVGCHPGSCAINATGEFWQSNSKHGGYAEGFHAGDVVGSGLLLTKAGQLGLFFTKNGRLNGKPIVLDHNKQPTSLYPAASFSPTNASMEANFGTDPAGKPFLFDLEAHRALLFDTN